MLKKDLIIIVIISLILVGVINYVSTEYRRYDYPVMAASDTLMNVIEVETEYGLAIDSFDIYKGKVKRNQFLADMLGKFDVPYVNIDKLVRNSKEVFDVRRMKVGNRYAVFSSLDSVAKAKYLVYEESSIDYIVFHLGDSLYAERQQKEVTSIRKHVKGSIESSLWNAMKDADANPMLAVELSEIYAWTVDFFGIQKGDAFEVIYDEQYVDSLSVGIETIHFANFRHYGDDNKAYHFMQDSVWSYFDEEGNSLRKAFLKAPLRFSRISSKFSNSRLHPVLKIRRPHHGIDYAAPSGTPVYSIGDGVVIKKGYQKRGGGNYIKIKHNSVYTTVYMHFSKFAKGMATGKKIQQGQVIGYVGKTGLATGPHLDFRVFKNGKAIDPLKVESPPVDPVKETYTQAFKATVKHWDLKLLEYAPQAETALN